MISAIDISLSGMNAASARVNVAAGNIVNARGTGHGTEFDSDSEPYQPLRVVQSSRQEGGVRAEVVPERPLLDEIGTAQFPIVSLGEEMVEMKLAAQAYEASLAVLEAEGEMLGELLDSVS
jgi:flagellar basal body rod protein FlgC